MSDSGLKNMKSVSGHEFIVSFDADKQQYIGMNKFMDAYIWDKDGNSLKLGANDQQKAALKLVID